MAQHDLRLTLLLITGLAVATSLAACSGSSDDDASPTPSEAAPQAVIPVAPPEPEPFHLPGTVSPADLPPSETAAAVAATAPATALALTPGTDRDFDPVIAPAPPSLPAIEPIPRPSSARAAPVVGPLLVFSSPVGADPVHVGAQESATRRVSLYDTATDQYWDAFDYFASRPCFSRHWWDDRIGRSLVQPAGTQLIVCSRDQIVRVAHTGQVETVLFEDAAIRAFAVSPDGAHVAILHGEPGTLVVLDAVTGAERVRLASSQPALQALRSLASWDELRLGSWQADGTAVSITVPDQRWRFFPRDPDVSGAQEPVGAIVDSERTAIIGLDGTTRILQEDWWPLSPDLRYAIRRGSVIKAGKYAPGNIWDRWDVVDVATGALQWTIAAESGIREFSPGSWLDAPPGLAFHVADQGHRILDIRSGEVRAVTRQARSALVRGSCRRSAAPRLAASAFPHPCDLWATYHGQIEVPEWLRLRGPARQPVVSAPVLPSPPPRAALVGPLFLYEIAGPYEAVVDRMGDSRHVPTRRVMAYDEGTGQRWLVFHYRSPTVKGWPGRIQITDHADGFVVSTDQGLRYVAVDGHTTPLGGDSSDPAREWLYWRDAWGYPVHEVSPDGQKVVANYDDQIAVFDLPSGDVILRVSQDDLVARWEEHRPRRGEEPYGACVRDELQRYHGTCYIARLNRSLAWGPDSETLLIRFGIGGHDFGWVGTGTIGLDGAITLLDDREHPEVLEPATEPRGSSDCRDAPAFPCRILLEDRVVGAGRWPAIIGLIELD